MTAALLEGFVPVYAADVEGRELGDLGAVRLGVGKAAAAASTTELLLRSAPRGLLLFGVAGAYPERHRGGTRLRIGDLCLVSADRLADEGVLAPEGFVPVSELLPGVADAFETAPVSADVAQRLEIPLVSAVTVSTCSGTDASSSAMCARTDAMIETMEGAAVALVCARYGTPLVHLRAISNYTGDRERGEWDLARGVSAAQRAVRGLLGA